MAITLSGSGTPSILAEDFGSSGASPSLTLTDTTGSAEDYTLTADADKLTITSSGGAGGAEVVIDGSLVLSSFPAIGAATGQIVLKKSDGTLTTDGTQLTWDSANDAMSVNGMVISTGNMYVPSGNLNLGLAATAPSLFFNGSTNEVVINETGVNADFRVEGDTDANLIFADASTDRVGIGTASPTASLTINHATAPEVRFKLAGTDTGGIFADSSGLWLEPASGDGLTFRTNNGFTRMTIDSAGLTTINGSGVIFNEPGSDADFRVEGDTNANLLFVDASTDRVGIGTATPNNTLDVSGNVHTSATFYSSLAASDTPGSGWAFGGANSYWGFGSLSDNSLKIDTYNTGAAYQKSFQISRDGVVSGSSNLHGEYAPTLTNGTNVAASTVVTDSFRYIRLGNQVIVFGQITVDPTAAADTDTELGISLPFASNLSSSADLSGTGAGFGTTNRGLLIAADTTNDRAQVTWRSDTTSNLAYAVQFMYEVK